MEIETAAQYIPHQWCGGRVACGAYCDGEQCETPNLGYYGDTLGDRGGLGSNAGSVGHMYCGRWDFAVEQAVGCPIHGLDVEYGVDVFRSTASGRKLAGLIDIPGGI